MQYSTEMMVTEVKKIFEIVLDNHSAPVRQSASKVVLCCLQHSSGEFWLNTFGLRLKPTKRRGQAEEMEA